MASVSSVSSSSSIYGTRNVITGLASGMDTESMIENAISAYKTKISALQQKRTKTEWKQDSYRSIINKMSAFMDKYTSYRSSNNLMSASFFNQAVKTVAKGKYADKVSATGKASSDIQINRVKQLATAATYTLSGSVLDTGTSSFGGSSVSAVASGTLDLDGEMTLNGFSGSMTLAYGGSNARSYLSIDFDETKTYANAQELADEINKQLKGQTVTIGSTSYTGDNLLKNVVRAEVGSDGKITFADPKKNNVFISNASDSVKQNLLGGAELSSTYDKQVKSLNAANVGKMQETKSTYEYLQEKGASMQITLDGVTKSIKLPTANDIPKQVTGQARDAMYVDALQKNIDNAFGAGKITVSDANKTDSGDGKGIQFQFTTAQKGSTLSVSSSQGKALGLGESGQASSYLNTSKTLGELLGDTVDFGKYEKAVIETKDSDGNIKRELAKDANGKQLYSFQVNGVEIGQFNEDSKLSDVLNAMNNNSDSGVKVSYSKMTNSLSFTAKETGANSKIEFSGMSADLFNNKVEKLSGNFNDDYGLYLNDGETGKLTVHLPGMDIGFDVKEGMTTQDIADKINKMWQQGDYKASVNEMTGALELQNEKTGGTAEFSMDFESGGLKWAVDMPHIDTGYTAGQDAVMDVTINGTKIEGFTRSSNTVDLDGLSVTLKGTFETEEGEDPVTFETSSDADKIVDVIKQMVEDYNAMVTEIKNAYSTLPAQRSNGAYYEPLTDEDQEGMSESAIKNWEDKAKQGILFGDRDLANLYQRLTSAVSMTGEFGSTLRAAGITVNYSNGLSTLEFNETEFRAALDKDPDAVRDAFVSSTESGAKSNGLMQALKQPLDLYGKTSGGKGILVEKAGSPLAASTMYTNTIQQELNNIDEQIEKWQDKMSDKVDYYTNQFSRLEQLIQQMNSQSSYFSQLMGG